MLSLPSFSHLTLALFFHKHFSLTIVLPTLFEYGFFYGRSVPPFQLSCLEWPQRLLTYLEWSQRKLVPFPWLAITFKYYTTLTIMHPPNFSLHSNSTTPKKSVHTRERHPLFQIPCITTLNLSRSTLSSNFFVDTLPIKLHYVLKKSNALLWIPLFPWQLLDHVNFYLNPPFFEYIILNKRIEACTRISIQRFPYFVIYFHGDIGVFHHHHQRFNSYKSTLQL